MMRLGREILGGVKERLEGRRWESRNAFFNAQWKCHLGVIPLPQLLRCGLPILP